MSGGLACSCPERAKRVSERRWVVVQFMANCSAFNGYHRTSSDYSAVQCHGCMSIWRTKAEYVWALPHGEVI